VDGASASIARAGRVCNYAGYGPHVGGTSNATLGLIRSAGRPRLAWDCRRRFLESFGETVLGRDPAPLAARLAELFSDESAAADRELDSEARSTDLPLTSTR
jgi:hypothetical protein